MVPFEHTMPLMLPLLPEGRQTLLEQQPPPLQLLPGQHAWPAPPQAVQRPALQAPPLVHIEPDAMQRPAAAAPGSQHAPPEQVWPGQHASPAPPQGAHMRAPGAPVHIRPGALQLSPQHGWPAAPHGTHWFWLLQVAPAPVQVAPAQSRRLGALG